MHGTHCDDAEIALLAERGASVCACPTTEGEPRRRLRARPPAARGRRRLCVGSDSNVRILDPLEELRELEHVARRTALRRNVLVADGDDGPAPTLLRAAGRNGARALGLPEPRIAAGAPADLVASPGRRRARRRRRRHLAAALVFAGSAALVTRTWVDGR